MALFVSLPPSAIADTSLVRWRLGVALFIVLIMLLDLLGLPRIRTFQQGLRVRLPQHL